MVGFDLNGDLLWVKKYHRNPLDLRMHPSNIKCTFLTHQENCFWAFSTSQFICTALEVFKSEKKNQKGKYLVLPTIMLCKGQAVKLQERVVLRWLSKTTDAKPSVTEVGGGPKGC